MRPEEAKVDNTFFDNQLLAIDCAMLLCRTRKNPALTRHAALNPTVACLSTPRDLVSAFSRNLWMMYQIRATYWRKNANSVYSATESNRLHRGTHDLGFMVHNSFGKGYTLTNEKAISMSTTAAQKRYVNVTSNVKPSDRGFHNKNVGLPCYHRQHDKLELLFGLPNRQATHRSINCCYPCQYNHQTFQRRFFKRFTLSTTTRQWPM